MTSVSATECALAIHCTDPPTFMEGAYRCRPDCTAVCDHCSQAQTFTCSPASRAAHGVGHFCGGRFASGVWLKCPYCRALTDVSLAAPGIVAKNDICQTCEQKSAEGVDALTHTLCYACGGEAEEELLLCDATSATGAPCQRACHQACLPEGDPWRDLAPPQLAGAGEWLCDECSARPGAAGASEESDDEETRLVIARSIAVSEEEEQLRQALKYVRGSFFPTCFA